MISGSPFRVPGGTASPGLSVVGQDHMNGSGHQNISGSDICHFWVKCLIAGVRPRQVVFPSTMIAVSVPDGSLSTCLRVEQNPWKPHAGYVTWKSNRPLLIISQWDWGSLGTMKYLSLSWWIEPTSQPSPKWGGVVGCWQRRSGCWACYPCQRRTWRPRPLRPAAHKQAIAHGSSTVDCPSHPNPSVNAWRSVKFWMWRSKGKSESLEKGHSWKLTHELWKCKSLLS